MPYIKVDNISIFYRKFGEGKPPLVFLHGMLYDSSTYITICEVLSQKYTVYSLDLPMHGKSSNICHQTSLEEFSKILGKIIKKLNLEKVTIIAHSAGALVALNYISKNKIKELILLDPAGIQHLRSKTSLLFKLIILKTIKSLINHPIRAIRTIKSSTHNISRNIFNKYFFYLLDKEYNKDYTNKIKKISVKTTIVWGKDDEILPHKLSKHYHALIPKSKLITIKLRHDWPVLDPKKINVIFDKDQ